MNRKWLNRKLVIEPRDPYSGDSLFSHVLSNMYFQDWHHGIVPFYVKQKLMSANVEPVTCKEFATDLFRLRRENRDGLVRSLCDFLEATVQMLILDGVAAYEICDVEATGKTLEPVQYSTLEITSDKVIQHLTQPNREGVQTIEIERDRLFLIEAPEWIEGGNGFPATISNLINETKREHTPLDHFQKQHEGRQTFFDFSTFRRTHEVRTLRLTRDSGWPARSLFQNSTTEIYSVMRTLTFYYNNLRLRDYLIEQVNQVLFPQLRRLGSEIQNITLAGVLSPSDILGIASRLEFGEIGLKEALEATKRYES